MTNVNYTAQVCGHAEFNKNRSMSRLYETSRNFYAKQSKRQIIYLKKKHENKTKQKNATAILCMSLVLVKMQLPSRFYKDWFSYERIHELHMTNAVQRGGGVKKTGYLVHRIYHLFKIT